MYIVDLNFILHKCIEVKVHLDVADFMIIQLKYDRSTCTKP
jgi:hypothetical protein